MITVFRQYKLPLVLGIVGRDPQDPALWAYFRELAQEGMEIARHTIHHYTLSKQPTDLINEELAASYQLHCEQMGECPVTLILPLGDGQQDPRVWAAASDFTFMVGITNGREFFTPPPFYLGRILPDLENQDITILLLRATYQQNP